jgi:hypothetical protein
MKLGFDRTKTSPWMSNIFEKHNTYSWEVLSRRARIHKIRRALERSYMTSNREAEANLLRIEYYVEVLETEENDSIMPKWMSLHAVLYVCDPCCCNVSFAESTAAIPCLDLWSRPAPWASAVPRHLFSLKSMLRWRRDWWTDWLMSPLWVYL